MSSIKSFHWFNVGIFFIFFLLFLHAVEDPDIWFHMNVGRAVLDQGTVPSEEFYIFTRLGQPSEFHEWGFGLVYHFVYSVLGVPGMVGLNALLGSLTVFLLYVASVNRGFSVEASLIGALLSFWLVEFRFVQRPETLLYLSIAFTIFAMEKYRGNLDWRWLGIIPAATFFLSQGHPSAIMVVFVTGAYLVEVFVKRPFSQKIIFQLTATIILALVVSVINPYGYHQTILPFIFSLQDELLNSLVEFLPALSTEYAFRFVVAICVAVLSLAIIWRRAALAEWVIIIVFAYLAFKHARNIALLGIVLALPVASAFNAFLARIKNKKLTWSAVATCFLLISFDALSVHRLRIDIDPISAPVKGADIVSQLTHSGNILNFMAHGNYLAWRLSGTHKVLVDGRNFNVNDSLIMHDDLLSARGNWQRILDNKKIVAIVTPATLPYSGDFVPLVYQLANHPQWALVMREPAGLTFVRRNLAPLQNVLGEQEVWLQAHEELENNLNYYPDSDSTRESIFIVSQKLGQSLEAN